jgi:predicted negative regulator of RcsB-dependent stress response
MHPFVMTGGVVLLFVALLGWQFYQKKKHKTLAK